MTVVAALIAVFLGVASLAVNSAKATRDRRRDLYQVGRMRILPEGVLLAATSNDSTVRLWWIPHGTTYAVLTGHTGWVRTCAFSPDGTIAATTTLACAQIR